jgi:formamidopyrimidine-DNA glycosylase
MPELPEVETVRRGLQPVAEGAIIETLTLNRTGLRFPFQEGLSASVQGAKVEALERRAKYLLWHLDNGISLIAHLGMSGSFRIECEASDNGVATPGTFHYPRSTAKLHDHVLFHMKRAGLPNVAITYNDPRRFGFLLSVKTSALNDHKLLAEIGIEPLGNAFNGDALFERFAQSAVSLKAALLDQKRIAGIGNIYACEALWAAALDPTQPASALARKDGSKKQSADHLAQSVRDVLTRAIEAGGSTLRDHRQADGELGYFQHSFNVYGREDQPCLRPGCRSTIKRTVQNGRSTFFCPSCQKAAR